MAYVPPKYPDEIPTIEDLPNRQDDTDWLVAARYNELKKELRAALIELGVLPKGTHADVAARLAAAEFKIAPIAALPAPAAEHRRKFYCIEGAVGVSDKIYACLKSAGGVGQWENVYDFEIGLYNVANFGNTFMVVCLGNGEIWRSTDGVTWTLISTTVEIRSRDAGGGVNLAFFGFDGTGSRAKSYKSIDQGLNWALENTFAAGERYLFRISPIWNNETYFGLYGNPNYGDVYKRSALGVYSRDLNTGSRAITCLHVSGINGYLYALTIDGALWEKQNAMAVWTLKHTFSSSYKWRFLYDDGTTVMACGGATTPIVQSSTDYNIWTNVTIPPEIRSRYAEFLTVIKFGTAWYFGSHVGIDGGDVIKLVDGGWSVDLDTGASTVQGFCIFNNVLYAASSGIVNVGILYRLSAALESYSWVKIAEG